MLAVSGKLRNPANLIPNAAFPLQILTSSLLDTLYPVKLQ